jgi:hypothetical protein
MRDLMTPVTGWREVYTAFSTHWPSLEGGAPQIGGQKVEWDRIVLKRGSWIATSTLLWEGKDAGRSTARQLGCMLLFSSKKEKKRQFGGDRNRE